MTRQSEKDKLELAIARLVAVDGALFTHHVNERSITHSLATILAPLFPDWNVDCEYNREGFSPKRLVLASRVVRTDDLGASTVYPDIIVHRRGTNENLLVVEAKKVSTSPGAYDADTEKLSVFTSYRSDGGLGYQFGALVLFSQEPSAVIHRWIDEHNKVHSSPSTGP